MPKSVDDLKKAQSEPSSLQKENNLEEEKKKARVKAMRLLEHMDRTEQGLYDKLKQADFSEHAIADAMAYVKSFGYINDQRYAEAYLRYRIGKKSRQQLVLELLRKGVDKGTIDLAWEEVADLEEPDERALIREMILKKWEPDMALDVKQMRRLQGQLLRRGFRGSDIQAVLHEIGITCDYTREYED